MPDASSNIERAIALLVEAHALLEVKPPEPVALQPQAAKATPLAAGLRIEWTNPVGSEALPVFLSWGTDGHFVGKLNLPAGTSFYPLTGLPASPHAIDLGYVMPGVTAMPLVRLTGTPTALVLPSEPDLPQPEPEVPSDYPSMGSATARRQAIVLAAGCPKSRALVTIASQDDLKRLGLTGDWSKGQWYLGKGGSWLEDLDVKGTIQYSGRDPLLIRNCKVQGIKYAEIAGKTGGKFQYVTVERNPNLGLGQGGINFWGQSGWVIDHCDISGFADGVQCVGPGEMRDSWVHDLAYGYSPEQKGPTHNDGIQNYGGKVFVNRSVFDMGGVAGSTNGALFCSTAKASFVATELFVETTRNDVNALHAWDSPEGIIVNGGRVIGGRLIGKVVLANVER